MLVFERLVVQLYYLYHDLHHWPWPVSDLYGMPLLWVLPHSVSLSIGLIWLGLSVWVVTQELWVDKSGPTVREDLEIFLLS